MTAIPPELLEKRLPEMARLQRLIPQLDRSARVTIHDRVTVDGHELPLYTVEFGSEAPNAPGIGLFAGVHGVERIGTEILLSFLYTLNERLGWESDLRALLDSVHLVVAPIVNPGGMWNNRRGNPRNVDLMRNAPAGAGDSGTFLVGGQRISRLLPWYRGRSRDGMEPEARFLVETVRRQLLARPVSITLDCHSGYGQQDRLWFLHANSKKPFKHLPEVYALKSLFENTYPNHDYYTIEPQSMNYLARGDLWDFLFQQSLERNQGLFIPLTLELGSLMWVRENLRQGLRLHGYFNPVQPGRRARTLRRHLLLLEFLLRAARNYKNWLTTYSDITNVQQVALREWYSRPHEQRAEVGATWILVRGLVRESRHWGNFPERFKARFPDASVHAVDIPGTGRVNDRRTPGTIGAILEAFRERLGELEIEPPYNVVAISMGAMLVMEWAIQHPGELDRTVLINPSVRNFNPLYERMKPNNYPRVLKHLLFRTNPYRRERAVLDMTTNLLDDDERERTVRQWVDYARDRPVSRMNALRQLRAASRYRLHGELPRIPMLVLGSAKDGLVDTDCSIRIASNWNLPLKIHPEAGHDIALDDPQWVIDSIEEWIAELDADEPGEPVDVEARDPREATAPG